MENAPSSNINNWSTWDAGSSDHAVLGDMMSQGSMRISPMLQQPTSISQSYYNPLPPSSVSLSTPKLSQLNATSKTRSEVSSLSNASPESRSLEDDLLRFDTITSTKPSQSQLSQSQLSRTSPHNRHSSPSDAGTTNSKVKKRTLNTLAARRYRQKRVDQVSGLETALKETETERDDLKLKVARLEAEVEVLRRLVGTGNASPVAHKS